MMMDTIICDTEYGLYEYNPNKCEVMWIGLEWVRMNQSDQDLDQKGYH